MPASADKTSAMRILIINQPYWPDIAATAQHMTDWAEHLASRGHAVTVIASRSRYGERRAVLPKVDQHHGVTIHRVGSNLFHNGKVPGRLFDFARFHLLALWRVFHLPRPDVVVCLTTPPFIGVVGLLLKAFLGCRYIQYEMDVYPDLLHLLQARTSKPWQRVWRAWVGRGLEGLHRKLLRSADRVIVLGRCMREHIEHKGIPSEKLALVSPWADPDEIHPLPPPLNAFRQEWKSSGRFVVVYAGNLGLAHDLDTLAGAIEQLNDGDGFQFVFVGGGRRMEELRRRLQGRGHVLIRDYVDRKDLPQLLAAADLHLASQAAGTAGLIVPSKFYGILAAGVPTLYVGPPDSEIARTIREHPIVGEAVAISDVVGMVAALRRSRDRFMLEPPAAESIREVLKMGHTRQQCLEKLTAIVEDVGKGRSRANR
jgi:glycosyltransferase involved in cell wall biosynthesis